MGRTILRALAFYIAAVALASCGGKATEPQTGATTPKPVASVQVTPNTHSLTAIGATKQFQAIARDGDGATLSGKSFTWASSSPAVATVNSTGLATAVTNGSSTITATTAGVSGTASLTVAQTSDALMMRTQPTGASAGQPFTTQPVLEVHDANGNVAENDNSTVVTAAIASGGGTLSGTTTATAASGVVTFADLAIGGTVGDRTLTFTAQALMAVTSASFSLAPGLAAQLTLNGGNNQTALAATAVEFSVKVTDAFDNGVPIVFVAWSVTSGSGTLASATSTTDANGIATNSYTLGRFAAVETVAAVVVELSGSPIGFSATATPNGTISGTISVTNALLEPPPVTSFSAPTGPRPVGSPVPPSGSRKTPLAQFRQSLQSLPVVIPQVAEPEYVPNELIVTFKPTQLSAPPIGSMALADPLTAQTVGMSMRAALASYSEPARLEVTGISPTILAARIKVADASELDVVAAQLRADPNVATVERNLITRRVSSARLRRFSSPTLPNDPLYPWQAWHYSMIDLPEAWSITTGDASVLVAVVDDGIRFDHSDIAANLTSDGYDFVSDFLVSVCAGGTTSNAGDGDGYDADPTQPASYDYSLGCVGGLRTSGNHGLHVAGTIGAAGNQGVGGSGVNWTVSIRPVRVLGVAGVGTDYDIAQGVLYAAGLPADDGAAGTVQASFGAKIINMSLGGSTPSTVQENAVIAASDAGSLIIASAGNDGTSVPNYPAAYLQTVSVSAVGPDAVLASYSSFGSTVDIAAPGGDLADGSTSFGVISTTWNYTTSTAIWDGWQGTSMAAPHVSGVAALLLAWSSPCSVDR